MATLINFEGRLVRQIVPSVGQSLLMLVIGLVVILVSQSDSILRHVGISQAGISTTQTGVSDQFHNVLVSAFAANLALIVFWSTIGLVAYLVCWGVYNIILELRNEVTLAAGYTNHGHWMGARQTLLLKAACAVGLGATMLTLKYGVAYWIALSTTALTGSLSPMSFVEVAAAVVGVAVQVYLVILFIQLTFTPWYTPSSFTAE